MPVYFIQAGDDGPVKIGYTSNVKRRLGSLQCGHYQKLKVIREINGDKRAEKRLHKICAGSHVRGEWFNFSEDILIVDPGVEPPIKAPTKKAVRVPTKLEIYLREQETTQPTNAMHGRILAIEARLTAIDSNMTALCAKAEITRSTVTRWKSGCTYPLIKLYDKLLETLEKMEHIESKL